MGESESVSYHGAVFQGAEFYGKLVFGAEWGTADFEGAEVAVGVFLVGWGGLFLG